MKMIKAIKFVFLVPLLMLADDIDLLVAKGILQNNIKSLEPRPAQVNVDSNVNALVTFKVELDTEHVRKNDIRLMNLDRAKQIEGTVSLIGTNTVSFRPGAPLPSGYYEISYQSLKPTKEEKEIQIKEIKYRFYVPEVINGYRLPPEPNRVQNNSTLLGIDINNNGVRDDAERYIVKRFQGFKNAHIDMNIALQYAKATQVIIQSPSEAWTNKTYKLMENAGDCKWYYFGEYLKNINNYHEGAEYREKHRVFDAELKDVLFNTKERLEAYLEYNDNLSGHIFEDGKETPNKCDFEVDRLLGGDE